MSTATIALVGDRSPACGPTRASRCSSRRSARATASCSTPTGSRPRTPGPTARSTASTAIWVVPGSPYRSAEGAIAAARTARERGIPFLGTCGGFQHAVLMLARDVCGIDAAAHAEYGPGGEPVIVALECSLVGHEGAITARPARCSSGSWASSAASSATTAPTGSTPRTSSGCSEHGVRFSAHDEAGDVRALELPDHPFFLGTLFQPELAGEGTRAHPVIRAFASACAARVYAGQPATG